MHLGIFDSLRKRRGVVIHAVMLALVLPMLLGLLPQPALSAAQTLDRAIAESLCLTSGNDGPAGQQQHPANGDACILCGPCSAAGPAPGEAARDGRGLRPTAVAAPCPPAQLQRPETSWLLYGSPPRGPPALPRA
jgi:hypothetical protein